jgi:acyl-CoA thioesterase-2
VNVSAVLSTFDLLGLQSTDDDRHHKLVAAPELCTPFGFLYGGAGIAASIAAAEKATERPLMWITTQFIGRPEPSDVVDLRVEIPAYGRATTQAQVTGMVGDRPVFTSLCAHTQRPDGDEAQFLQMPDVPGPADCQSMDEPFTDVVAGSFFDSLERRTARGRIATEAVGDPQPEGLALWCRIVDQEIGSPATQAYVADIVPLAVCAALGVAPGGTSIDNTIRIVDTRPSEWVLLELVPEGHQRSLGHGSVRLWSEDGRLLGTAQQTCIIRTSHHARRAEESRL